MASCGGQTVLHGGSRECAVSFLWPLHRTLKTDGPGTHPLCADSAKGCRGWAVGDVALGWCGGEAAGTLLSLGPLWPPVRCAITHLWRSRCPRHPQPLTWASAAVLAAGSRSQSPAPPTPLPVTVSSSPALSLQRHLNSQTFCRRHTGLRCAHLGH